MSIRYWAACLMALATGAAWAQNNPQDFAYGLPLEAPGAAGVYRLELPAAVYHHAVSPGLADLQVFNDAGEPVPQALQRRPSPAPPPPAAATRRVPHFPLPGNADSPVNVTVNTRDDGSIVSIQRSGPADTGQGTAAYLVDLSAVKGEVRSLRLAVAPAAGDDPGRLNARLAVAVSEELADWRRIGGEVPLVRLRYQGHLLERNTVPLPRNAGPYLRLSWPQAAGDYRLSGVDAVIGTEPEHSPLQWLEPAALLGGAAGEYRFDTGGRFPVRRLEVEPRYDNAFLQVRVESRPDGEAPWRSRFNGDVYRLNLDGTSLRSDMVHISVTRDRYWRLKVVSQPAGGAPRLRLGWAPEQLYFVAQGPRPYLLAVGSAASAEAAGRPGNDGLLSVADDRQVARAAVGDPRELGGRGRLQPPPEALPWVRIALWGVLLAAVGVLGLFAWRLYRQMDGDEAQ